MIQTDKIWQVAISWFIFLIVIFGCSQDEIENEKILELKADEKIFEISEHVGVIYTSIHLQKDLNCLISEKMSATDLHVKKEQSSEATNGKEILKKIINDYSKICHFYEKVIEETTHVFEKIKLDEILPNETFSFMIYLADVDGNEFTKKEEEIGLFLSLDSCEKIEGLAREYNIPTKKCSLFNEKDLSNSR